MYWGACTLYVLTSILLKVVESQCLIALLVAEPLSADAQNCASRRKCDSKVAIAVRRGSLTARFPVVIG